MIDLISFSQVLRVGFSRVGAASVRVAAGIWLAAAAATGPAVAEDALPQPAGPVILTVSGDIGRTTDGSKAYFDRAMLEALGVTTVVTTTPWTDGAQRFEGVLARAVMQAVQARGDVVLAAALNDYMAEIPIDDFDRADVIFAYRQNGETLTPRNKGPLFVIYPFDAQPELFSETIYARSVWQLVELDVR